jgi:hypothetical protein
MSSFIYFISQDNPLPFEVIKKAQSLHFSISDVTEYVKDKKLGCNYYECNAAVICLGPSKSDINWKNPYHSRKLSSTDFYFWICEEFKKLGNFKYIDVFEDGTKCDTGYYEKYFDKCKKIDITYIDFCSSLVIANLSLESDVLYNVIV